MIFVYAAQFIYCKRCYEWYGGLIATELYVCFYFTNIPCWCSGTSRIYGCETHTFLCGKHLSHFSITIPGCAAGGTTRCRNKRAAWEILFVWNGLCHIFLNYVHFLGRLLAYLSSPLVWTAFKGGVPLFHGDIVYMVSWHRNLFSLISSARLEIILPSTTRRVLLSRVGFRPSIWKYPKISNGDGFESERWYHFPRILTFFLKINSESSMNSNLIKLLPSLKNWYSLVTQESATNPNIFPCTQKRFGSVLVENVLATVRKLVLHAAFVFESYLAKSFRVGSDFYRIQCKARFCGGRSSEIESFIMLRCNFGLHKTYNEHRQ